MLLTIAIIWWHLPALFTVAWLIWSVLQMRKPMEARQFGGLVLIMSPMVPMLVWIAFMAWRIAL